jgi:hypothetical protein
MRQEIGELRRYYQQSKRIFEAVAIDGQSDFIIHKLQQNEPLEDIYKELTENSPIAGSLESGHSSKWWHESPQSDGSDDEVQASPSLDEASMDSFKHGSRWTDLSLSDTIIEQFLLLYFCWEYPIFSCLSKRHFAKDFNLGKGRYCSALLLNAILAIGSRLSDRVEARTDPDNSEAAGMYCYAEAERLRSMTVRTRQEKLRR